MKRWQYKAFLFRKGENLEVFLNGVVGIDGWEAFHFVETPISYTIFAKRRVDEMGVIL